MKYPRLIPFVLVAALLCLAASDLQRARAQLLVPKVPQFIASGAADVFGTVLSLSLTGTDTFGANSTAAHIFNNSLLTAPSGTPSKIRATFKAGSGTWNASAVTVCNQVTASACDCAATPTSVTFSGASSFTLGSGTSVTSDQVIFSWNKTKGICFRTFHASLTQVVAKNTSVSGAVSRYDSGDTTTSTTNPSNLNNTGQGYGLTLIETNGF